MHSVNILDIQQETLRLINHTQEVMTQLLTTEVVSRNASDQKQTLETGFLKKIRETLENEKQKAINMEMVIAVVGTMKSGKSTAINAIVGQEILPNRALPMTALPTLVTHKKGQATPVLTLYDPKPLIELSTQIKEKIKKLDLSAGYAFLGSDPGKALVRKLKQNGKLEIKMSYKGQKSIFDFLHQLNDLMRAAKEISIEPPYNEYQSINALPRIEVEFFHLKHNSGTQQGRLSLLDTPGPNEFGQSDALKEVFRQQLAQASAVLLVMDYTQLNSEADGIIREDVACIQDSLGERLYVLVNKFDNRNKNTMGEERTKKYVSEHLLKSVPSEHIFPVSSWLAYLANRALHELDCEGRINKEEDWVEDFGTEALGRRWINMIDDNHHVKECSVALWDDSNFENPLNLVIAEAHAKVAVESLGSILSKLSGIFNNLDNGMKGRLSGLQIKIAHLNEIITNLQNDQKNLGDIEKQVEKVIKIVIKKTKGSISEEICGYINEAEKVTSEFLEKGSKKEKEEKKARKKQEKKSIRLIFKSLLQRKKFKSDELQEALSSDNTNINFDDKESAKKLLELIQNAIENINNKLFVESEKILKKETETLQKSLNIKIRTKLAGVLEQAKKRLKDQGVNVDFKLPDFNKQSVFSFTMEDLVTSGFEEQTEEKSRVKITNRIFNFFSRGYFGTEIVTSEITKYVVDIKATKNKVYKGMTALRKSIEEGKMDSLEKQITENINQQISEVKEYLERYRGDLLQGINDQKKNSEKKSQYIDELKMFFKPLQDLSEDAKDQSSLLEEIIDPKEIQNNKNNFKAGAQSKKSPAIA